MTSVEEVLRSALEVVADRAGDRALKMRDKGADDRHAVDLVTEADLRVDSLVREGLDQLFPGVPVVSEEVSEGRESTHGDCFLLDPIDGTHNFASGLPFWAISLARMEGSTIREAWVLDGPRRGLYHARKGGPATHEGRVLEVNPRRPGLSLLSVGLSRRIVPLLMKANQFSGIRMLGCHSMGLALAASGEVGIHAGSGYPWDVAAGYLLIEAAGGVTVDFEGNPRDPWERGHALAGAPQVVTFALEILQEAEG